MNIKEAKQQIKNAIISYSTKDEYGDMIIPVNKQRPIFLSRCTRNWKNGYYGANC